MDMARLYLRFFKLTAFSNSHTHRVRTGSFVSVGEPQAARSKRRPERSDSQSELVRGQEPVLLSNQGPVPGS